MTEIAIIGADTMNVMGSAIGFRVCFGCEIWVGTLITVVAALVLGWLHAFSIYVLEYFFAGLLLILCSVFWVNLVNIGPSVSDMLVGLVVPTIPSKAIGPMIGLIGSIIMPHNL